MGIIYHWSKDHQTALCGFTPDSSKRWTLIAVERKEVPRVTGIRMCKKCQTALQTSDDQNVCLGPECPGHDETGHGIDGCAASGPPGSPPPCDGGE